MMYRNGWGGGWWGNAGKRGMRSARPRHNSLRSNSKGSAAARCTLAVEPLETRLMLSISPGDEAAIQKISWNGQDVDAYAGRWIVSVADNLVDGLVNLSRVSNVDLGPLKTRLGNTSAADAVDAVGNFLRGSQGGETLSIMRSLGTAVGQQLFELEAPATRQLADLRTALNQLPGFRYVEPDFVLSTQVTTPNDTMYSQLWGMNNTGQTGGVVDADIDAPEAWDLATGSSDIVVGVIDTGVDYTHSDLSANIWNNPGEIAGDGIDNDSNGFIDDVHGWDFANDDNDPMDDNNHGTHVSGTIGGTGNNANGVVGVNWNVRIMALKYLNSDGHGSTSNAVDALNYATMMRRDHGINIRLTSNSWGGGGFSQSLFDAIAASGEEDMLFIAAAGNGDPDGIGDDNDMVPFYPATYELDNIISVAATNDHDDKAGFSNFGSSTVDLGAPGVSVRSTVTNNSYSNFSGTSMATPHVAGVAALAWSVAPTASFQTIKDAILGGVDPIPAMQDITVTGGRLNAFGTLKQLGMRVISTSPAKNAVITDLRTDFAINFSNPYVAGSVAAGDLEVNGTPADSFTLTDADTITFHFNTTPIVGQGLQTIELADGAVTRLSDAAPLNGYTGTFRYDALPLAVSSTVPANGSTATLPLTSITVNFNEPIDTSSIDINDLALNQGTVTGTSVLGNSATYTVAGLINEGTLSLTMNAGAVVDVFGNPLVAYAGSVTLDFGTVPLPTTLVPVLPDGSLIYDPPVSGSIGVAGDTDSFTLTLLAGQVITVAVDPAAALQPTVELRDPSNVLVGSITAAAAGKDAVLQTFAVAATGTYTITAGGSGSTVGTYSLQVVVNAAVELESHDGPADNTFGAAQNLNSAFTSPGSGVSIAAVLGRSEAATNPPLPSEVESNNTTATANTATYNFAATSSNLYQQIISGTIQTNAESDWFRLGLMQSTDVLTLTLSSTDSSRGNLTNPLIELYRGNAASPTLVTSDNDNGPGFDALIYRWSLPADDTYYVRVKTSALTGTGTYQLAAWLENVGAAPTTSTSFTSDVESNNTAPFANDASSNWRAVSHLSHTTGAITTGDSDFYKFTFSVGDVVTLVADSTSSLDARVALLNSGGAVIASENGTSTGTGLTTDSSVYAYRIVTAGTYYVRVQPNSGTGAYNLDVYLSAAVTPPAPTLFPDWYAFDLTAGQRATLVLKGLSAGNVDLAFANPSGVDLATGVTTSTNADEMIHQFVAPSTGTYFARISSTTAVDYSLLVIRDAEFDTENNGTPAGSLVDLTSAHNALGFLDWNRPAFTGPVALTVDQAASAITISGDLEGNPFVEQQPGSLTTHYTGTLRADIKTGSIEFVGGSVIDASVHPGPFQPGNGAADYAGQINIGPGLTAYGIFTSLINDALSGKLAVDGSGHFAANNISVAVTDGDLQYSIPGFATDSYDLTGTNASNESAQAGLIEEINGVLYVTIPVEAGDSLIDPNTGLQFNLHLSGTIKGSLVLAPRIDPDDYYQVSLAAGETLTVTTATPLDVASAVRLNTLDPTLELLNAGNVVVASDANSAPDGRNAVLQFTAVSGGTYKIHVQADAGKGEYLLHTSIASNQAPVLAAIGNQSVNEGDTLSFTAQASDPNVLDQLTFSLAPGAPAGASIHPTSGLFSWTAGDNAGSPFSVTIIVSDNGTPILSDSETIQIAVNNVAPTANAGGPYTINAGDSLNLNGSGTDPIDTLTYSWDVNGDNTFGDATGASPTLTWSQLQSLSIGPGTTITNLRVRTFDGTDTTTSSPTTLHVSVPATIQSRLLFYNQSKFDGNNASINAADDAAIATDKTPYFPNGTAATFGSVSSYTKGINGIMIDIAGDHGTITAADFKFRMGNNNAPGSWNAPVPTPTVSVRGGAGANGSDRVVLTWANNAIYKNWLEVQVKGNDALGGNNLNTGLATTDVFFWGNAPGDVGSGDTATRALVNATDELDIRGHQLLAGATVTNVYDIDRTGNVGATEQLFVRGNGTIAPTAVILLNVSAAGPFAPEGDSAAEGDSEAAGDGAVASALAITAGSEHAASSVGARLAGVNPAAVRLELATARRDMALLEHLARATTRTLSAAAGDELAEIVDDDLLDVLAAGR